MKNDDRHIIHKVFIEVHTQSKEKAYELKDDINSFLNIEVFPEIERYFDQLMEQYPDFVVQLDQLTLDINTKNIELNQQLKQELIVAVQQQIQESLSSEGPKLITKQGSEVFHKSQHKINTLLHFIEYGTAPWWQGNTSITQLLDQTETIIPLIKEPKFITKLLPLLQKPTVIQRILNQFLTRVIQEMIMLFIETEEEENKISELAKLHTQIDSFSTSISRNCYTAILETIAKRRIISITAIQNIIKDVPSKEALNSEAVNPLQQDNKTNSIQNIKTEDYTSDSKETISVPIHHNDKIRTPKSIEETNTVEKNISSSDLFKEEKDLYMKNAGLVLVHPFIVHLFTHCKLLDENKQLINPELATHILHFVATGRTQQVESDLLFEKFLCGIPQHHSINRHIELSEFHKEHSKKLLNAVKTNWSPMKTSSDALLQNEFLQREGKLEFVKEQDAMITVERKTQDILLGKLSWGISLIRLPWKEGLLHVHWT